METIVNSSGDKSTQVFASEPDRHNLESDLQELTSIELAYVGGGTASVCFV